MELEDYPELFTGLGCLPGTYHIERAEGAVPVVHAPRKGTSSTESESCRGTKKDGKARSKPTEWVNSLVVVHKSTGAIRLCIDPRDLNLAIKRPHYPMKTIDEVTSRLQGANTFSVLDAACGFWQLKLDEESSCLC